MKLYNLNSLCFFSLCFLIVRVLLCRILLIDILIQRKKKELLFYAQTYWSSYEICTTNTLQTGFPYVLHCLMKCLADKLQEEYPKTSWKGIISVPMQYDLGVLSRLTQLIRNHLSFTL